VAFRKSKCVLDGETGFARPCMNIQDRNGVLLQEKCKQGIKTYLGTMVPEMPSSFILYGQHSPSALANGPPFLELQVDWVAQLLKKANAEGISTVEPSAEAAVLWSTASNTVYRRRLHRETPS
jgi:cation diffusion facilitator CzcD-associated flavoprotein CzcO